ncbi:MAG: Asp-tRNA(Asn)/Glu-tRNA(Gln) amidotransferase GatCAB subunit A, partial [Acidobacteriota bacterium]
MTLAETIAALDSGQRSSTELTRECLDAIARHNERLGAFLSVEGERALERAAAIDRRRSRGDEIGA